MTRIEMPVARDLRVTQASVNPMLEVAAVTRKRVAQLLGAAGLAVAGYALISHARSRQQPVAPISPLPRAAHPTTTTLPGINALNTLPGIKALNTLPVINALASQSQPRTTARESHTAAPGAPGIFSGRFMPPPPQEAAATSVPPRPQEAAASSVLPPPQEAAASSVSPAPPDQPIRTVPGPQLVQFKRKGPRVPVQPSAPAYLQALQRTDGPGWAAADGTISIRLPDGRDLWLYGDTMLNLPRANGTLRRNADFVRNSAVLQDGNRMTTLVGGTAKDPDDFLKPPGEPNRWYWPGHGIAEGDELVLFMGRIRSTAEGNPGWNFAPDGSDMVRLNLSDLSVKSVVRLPGSETMAWGSTVVSDETYTYVYGMETGSGPFDRFAHIARAPKGTVGDGSWEFWDGDSWNPDPAMSRPILQGVSNQFTVLPNPQGGWALVSQSIFLQPDLYVANAPSPEGPWTPLRELTKGIKLRRNEISYNAMVHPQFSHNGKLVVSWNINKSDGTLPTVRELNYYRARFGTINASALNAPA